MPIVNSYEDFYASHDHMPGKSRTMRVSGTVIFSTGGCSGELRPTEGNTGINPEMLSLDLVLTSASGPAPEVLTPCAVEWEEDNIETEYSQVQFRVVGTDDEPPPVIDVEHPE